MVEDLLILARADEHSLRLANEPLDMTITAGRVIALTNKSGTWLPRGPHLVATLRWLVLVNIISADAVYNGTVKVEQFIKNESDDGQNPDDGDLYRILGEALRGKLI